MTQVKVIPSDDVDASLLASEIVKVSKAAQELLRSKLTEKALLLLLSHSSGVNQRTCKLVLHHASHLARAYVK